MDRFHCVEAQELEQFLRRRWAALPFPEELDLAQHLREVLRKANQFVPSQAGSILLDHPDHKNTGSSDERLTFIAAFGDKAERLLGESIDISRGIAGHVYRSGRSHRSEDVGDEPLFDPAFDESNDYETRSLVAIPVRIGTEVCGVLELLNRDDEQSFSQRDVVLLEIFSDYLSISIQNVLDARRAQEIAQRDGLTGLYNDRSLHIALTRLIESCRQEGEDLSLLFLDLDYFKRVNDSHGHLAGSQVLQEVGALLRAASEKEQAIAARYGGDEFVIAAADKHIGAAIELAEMIREKISRSSFCERPSDIQQEVLRLTGITCSIGIASLKRHTDPRQDHERCKGTLLRLADAAMYVAKETGRNRTAVAGELVTPRFSTSTPPASR